MFVAFDRSPAGAICIDHQPLKSVAMLDRIGIGLPGRIKPPGIGRCVPSFARWFPDCIEQAAAALVTGTNC